jgi:uncharacterized protein (DUF58 family)
VAGARDPGRRRGPALSGAGAARPLLPRLRSFARRHLRPPRTLRPTRAGWLFFALAFGVGFAALNTGNNLLYLILSLMLAFLVLSGVLSEAALRGIDVVRQLPFEWLAGQPGRVVLEVVNAQRFWAHAIVVEDCADAGAQRPAPLGRVLALRIAPGGRERRSYSYTHARRGELAFAGLRVTTRFPFGLFAKSLWIERPARVLVYPALVPAAPPALHEDPRREGLARRGRSAAPTEVSGLREFARGDATRRVHWPASWRRGLLLVRDAEGETAGESEVRLQTAHAVDGAEFESAVSRAASQAEAGLRAGLRVGLRTDGVRLEPGAGPVHRARLLGTLALVGPESAESGGAAP